MSTTPVTPAPVPNTVIKTVETEATVVKGWLVTPWHAVLAAAAVTILIVGTYMFASRRASEYGEKATAAVEAAQKAQDSANVSAKQNALFQAQTTQQIAQLQEANDELIAANKRLVQTVNANRVQLANQKKSDATMTPTDQSKRWQALVPASVVTPTATGFTIDAQGGLLTIQDLEALPIQTTEIASLQTELTNTNKLVSNDATALAAEKAAHALDLSNAQAQLSASKAETVAVQAKLTAQKKATMRTRLRWFGAGFVTGVVTTVVAVVK
jgi:hypothetical protein